MSDYIDGEVLEFETNPVDGVCLGAGHYPDDAKFIPSNKD